MCIIGSPYESHHHCSFLFAALILVNGLLYFSILCDQSFTKQTKEYNAKKQQTNQEVHLLITMKQQQQTSCSTNRLPSSEMSNDIRATGKFIIVKGGEQKRSNYTAFH